MMHGIKMDENLRVWPMTGLWVDELDRLVSARSGESRSAVGHRASRADAATTSTPTYAKVAMDIHILLFEIVRK